jgi:hypothetical protein
MKRQYHSITLSQLSPRSISFALNRFEEVDEATGIDEMAVWFQFPWLRSDYNLKQAFP